MKTPKFWYSKNNLYSKLLIPLSFIWILGSFIKRKKAHKFSNIKIIKIGNVVVGGAGKTPTTIAIAKKLINSWCSSSSCSLVNRVYFMISVNFGYKKTYPNWVGYVFYKEVIMLLLLHQK